MPPVWAPGWFCRPDWAGGRLSAASGRGTMAADSSALKEAAGRPISSAEDSSPAAWAETPRAAGAVTSKA